jgi:hypothetical protein
MRHIEDIKMVRMLISEECIKCRQKAKMMELYLKAREKYEV